MIEIMMYIFEAIIGLIGVLLVLAIIGGILVAGRY